ncbi:hypothetical protein Dsin_002988 [Dipteronia sinensis]|uniref:Reverse transcriptase zinc-binding domain-containing protein n=1 Tax=Dipteronia sinensis TaxID=43782 RepID=A0AAE0B751_9ROSI|nr:hypothetical protein Dsin_002988 [Dipteronia sinensis]
MESVPIVASGWKMLGRKEFTTVTDCPVCLKCLETVIHALWGCKYLNRIRVSCGFMNEEMCLLSIVWWRVWFFRNKVVHGDGDQDWNYVVPWSVNFLHEYRSVHEVGVVDIRPTTGLFRWQPPLRNLYKINTDAALDVEKQIVGVGVVVHDHRE